MFRRICVVVIVGILLGWFVLALAFGQSQAGPQKNFAMAGSRFAASQDGRQERSRSQCVVQQRGGDCAEKIGRETVTCVDNICQYYIAYKLVTEEMEDRQNGREGLLDK